MKTNQIFVISAIVITTTFFGALSVFDLPESVTDWLISDVILGAILYINYLVIAMLSDSPKSRMHYTRKKVTV
ncbi:C4-dicarboxylate ABC transporter [Nitrosomonas ureae]|uniref:C4-dicarboxylate ABC transporter n=1 Tax=Nitrosomonas ureae TaxID=44577 RepID=A0A1H5SXT4_9PROT|nr:C4-dicarboxylate ABC transporter [Nitrosomonas ureae]SEF54748.1 hypothetical protein SAMN05216334_103119 [Nitrosomonas ureae]